MITMREIFYFLLFMSMSISSQNGFTDWDKKYVLQNPIKIINKEISYASSIEKQDTKAQYYVGSGKYRFIATFTGGERKISKDKMAAMARVVSVKFGKKDFITYDIVRTELEFVIDKQKIWMPIQNVLLPNFKNGIKTNQDVLLYTLFLNEHTRSKELNNHFFISEFTKEWTVPKKQLWAASYLNRNAPKFIVEEWISDPPNTSGKFVLIDFWATWCGPCRKVIPELNKFHEEFKNDLVVIGVSDESKRKVEGFLNPKIHYYSAIDTEKRLKKSYEVKGVPHCVLIDPNGIVRWEGFPMLKGYELTSEVIGGIIKKYQ